jgi:hypothetical protein
MVPIRIEDLPVDVAFGVETQWAAIAECECAGGAGLTIGAHRGLLGAIVDQRNVQAG